MSEIDNQTPSAKKPLTTILFNTYLQQLVHQLKTNDKVLCSSVLRSKKWNKGCYSLLSNLISTDLLARMTDTQLLQTGSSISAKTLQKIVEGNYAISLPIDPRVINTLNKIVFFLEFKHWDDFVAHMSNLEQEAEEKSYGNQAKETKLNAIVQQAIETEFSTYLNLPKLPAHYLANSFVNGGQAFNKIMELLLMQQNNHCIISNPYNPSTFEILNLKTEALNDNDAQVTTTEFWEICWWQTDKQQYLKRYKNISKHIYILKKIDAIWKVKTNASLSDFLQVTENTNESALTCNQIKMSGSAPFTTVSLLHRKS